MTTDFADQAAPLDALLVDAALGPLARLVPDASTALLGLSLVRHPSRTGRSLFGLSADLVHIGAGTATPAPSTRDRRFADPAWQENPVLRRVVQAYLATARTTEQLIADAGLSARHERRVRFLVDNLVEAFSPSNVPLLNPASAKTAIDTAGLSLLRGGRNLLRDMAAPPRVPQMVNGSPFQLGRTVATTAGAVVLRTEVLELIQYRPQTEQVREVPVLLVPPTINKYYVLDLAPGRSLVEYLVQQGLAVFTISWRNPRAEHASWGVDAYLRAVLDALDAVQRISGADQAALFGFCSGGILAATVAGYLAATDRPDQLAALGLGVTVLDFADAGLPGALIDRRLATAAKAVSRRRGYLDGRVLAEVFAWLRPGDLIWSYWVNNYLLGRTPPAFDILFWNADTTRMTATLHADLVDIAMDNTLVRPGALAIGGVPLDLSGVGVDGYVVAGSADHLTPWHACYRSTQLFGGASRFILSNGGHIAALINPPGNPKSSYQVNAETPAEPQAWLDGADTRPGTWWPDAVAWLGARCGPDRPAPRKLGGKGLPPLFDAPGTYVFDR